MSAGGGKIRVLHLRDTHETGGPGKTILETFSHMDKDRFEVHLGVFRAGGEQGDSPFISEALRRGMPLHLVESSHQYSPGVLASLLRLMGRLKCDILHTHETRSDVLGLMAARICRVPAVTTLHGWIGNSRKDRLMIALDRAAARRFDRVIAVSKAMHSFLMRSGFDASRVRLLHNAIVTGKYRDDGRRGYLAQKAGISLKRPVIGTVGRLSREKGHADFLEAVSILCSRGREADFVLVGDGPERERLAGMIRRLGMEGRVHMAGYLGEMQRVYQDLDLMVLPSHTEGLPNVVLESLMMGVPVVATNVGGTPDIITDGDSGVLVEPGRPEALAAAMEEFLEDREGFRRMAGRGRAVVEAEFDFKERTRRLEGIYEELVSRRRG